MIEKIGQVQLELKWYPGQDFYSDGAVEEEMLEIARNYREDQWNRVIAERKSWPVLYHFSHVRENIVSWLPFTGRENVLEIGAGCGAVTGVLCKKAGKVTCIELSKRRSEINAWRHRDRKNLKILVGNFQEIEKNLTEKYDYITLIGVFEYGEAYIDSATPYVDFLKTIASHLKPDGKIILAIENRFGLKYWAGCTEDHFGALFEGLEGYRHSRGVKTFTQKELNKLLEEAGGLRGEYYYPFPDYKFPVQIFSDERLPGKGELNRTEFNYDRLRLSLFEESAVFDSLGENDLFPQFSNSFLVIIGRDNKERADKILYSKFSNERAEEFSVYTQIGRNGEGHWVRRHPSSIQARPHAKRLLEIQKRLKEAYEKEGFFLNACKESEDGSCAELEYLEGQTLEEILDGLLEEKKIEALEEKLFWYLDKIRSLHSKQEFTMSEEFARVFGNPALPDQLRCAEASNVDLVAGNLIINQTGNHIVDYEWTFFFPVPANYLLYRILHYYIYSDQKRLCLEERGLFEKAGITDAELCAYEEMERSFQRYILGEHIPMRNLYTEISPGKVDAKQYYQQISREKQGKLQVFWGKERNFSEEASAYYPFAAGKNEITITLPEEASYIRIDPGEEAIICRILGLTCLDDGKTFEISTNGICLGNGTYAFLEDPQIYAGPFDRGKKHFLVELEKNTDKEGRKVLFEFAQKKQQESIRQREEIHRLRQELESSKRLIREMENTKVWKMYRRVKKQ